MARGYFHVFRDSNDSREIHFHVGDGAGDPPADQLELKSEVEEALLVIQALFKKESASFERYFRSLLALAQCGLGGDNAQPEVARRALESFKADVLNSEAGNVKNKYWQALGIEACVLGGIAALLALLFWWPGYLPGTCFALNWSGAMLGVWLSFGARKVVIRFNELIALEKDRVEPRLRLVFAGALTLLLAFIFYKQGVVVEFGPISTRLVGCDVLISFLVGSLCGFSELALPSRLAKHAEHLLPEG